MGCQAWVKFSPTCFSDESDRRWCLGGIQITLVVRGASRASSRSLTLLRPAGILPFFRRGGAPQAHDSLVANLPIELDACYSSVGEQRSCTHKELGSLALPS